MVFCTLRFLTSAFPWANSISPAISPAWGSSDHCSYCSLLWCTDFFLIQTPQAPSVVSGDLVNAVTGSKVRQVPPKQGRGTELWQCPVPSTDSESSLQWAGDKLSSLGFTQQFQMLWSVWLASKCASTQAQISRVSQISFLHRCPKICMFISS